MKNPQIIDEQTFIQLLRSEKGLILNNPYIVQGSVQIDGAAIALESFCIDNIAFNGRFEISNQPNLKSVSLRSCNFLLDEGFYLKNCRGGFMSIQDMKASGLDFYDCAFDVLSLSEVHLLRTLDLSGLAVTKRLSIEKVSCETCELISHTGDRHLHVPFVRVDDPVFVRQFELARIPVFSRTASIREHLAQQPVSLQRVG